MKFADLARKVASIGAPLVGTALGGPAGAVVGKLVANRLGLPDNATASTIAGVIDANPKDTEASLRAMDADQRLELERLTLEAETARMREETARQAQVNTTMRAEARSESAFVRGWRPTFGYIVGGVVGAFGLTLCYALLVAVRFPEPARIEMLTVAANLVASLQVPFAAVLAVLGVSVAKRSADKAHANGGKPQGFIGGLLAGLGKK